jgi:uncharacterized protein YlaI
MISVAIAQDFVKCTYCDKRVEKNEAHYIGHNMINGKPMYMCQECWNADASEEEEEDV